LTGNQLTKLFALPLIGYVAQLVSTGCKYKSLEGDLFGDRVGTYTAPTILGPWRTLSGIPLPPGKSIGGDPVLLNGTASNDERKEPWHLVLYKSVPGAFEGSTEDDHSNVATVSRDVLRSLRQNLRITEPSNTSTNLAVDLAENTEAPDEDETPDSGNASSSADGLPPTLLPEEPAGDDNLEPDSDEENIDEPMKSFIPSEEQLDRS